MKSMHKTSIRNCKNFRTNSSSRS